MLPNPKEMEENLDPRVKRTRGLILQSFESLLAEKGFESISVQDVTDKAQVNRATFSKSLEMSGRDCQSSRCSGWEHLRYSASTARSLSTTWSL